MILFPYSALSFRSSMGTGFTTANSSIRKPLKVGYISIYLFSFCYLSVVFMIKLRKILKIPFSFVCSLFNNFSFSFGMQ